MQKTILIGALLLGTLAQANMDICKSSIKLMGVSADKGIEAMSIRDFSTACSYVQLANSFIETAMANCPLEVQAKLQGAYVQGKQTEVTVCKIK